MESSYSITILDRNGKKIGELVTGTRLDIMKFINKGFTVVDNSTGMNMTSELMSSTIGVSECIINLG